MTSRSKPDSSAAKATAQAHTAQDGPSFTTHPLLQEDGGLIRTDMHCTECGKDFVAMLEGLLDGHHKVVCPHCRHIHYRVIRAGIVTEERHTPKAGEPAFDVPGRHVWKSAVQPIMTSSASALLRDAWFKR